MIYNIFNPIYITLSGTAYTYKSYTIQLHTYYTKGSVVEDNLSTIYSGSAFIGNGGTAKVKIDDILCDYMYKYSPNFLKNNSGDHNNTLLEVTQNSNSEFVDVIVGGTTIECFCGDFDKEFVKMNVPNSNDFLLWMNYIYNESGVIKTLNLDGTSSSETIKDKLSCVEISKLGERSQIQLDDEVIVNRVDDCTKKYYVTFRMSNGRTYCKGFENGVKGYDNSLTEIEDQDGVNNVIHKELKETLQLNTGVLSKTEYNLLNEMIFSDYVLVYDCDNGTNYWYRVSPTSLSNMSDRKRMMSEHFTINLEKVEKMKY